MASDHPALGEHYLESSIATASPAKLRLMLLERSVEVATRLASVWRNQSGGQSGVNEHSIKLLELLSELLSGITDRDSEVCSQVADLYVFLCQHLVKAEDTSDADAIDEIRLVLETETETWRMACARKGPAPPPQADTAGAGQGGLDLCG